MARQTQAGHKQAGMKIKKGDTVVVLAGKDRGREGKVIAAYPSRRRVLVQGVNIIRKNTKVNFQGARGAKEGGIVTFADEAEYGAEEAEEAEESE